MDEFIIRHLVSGGVISNYFCTSKCGHCLYNCSPLRDNKYLDAQTAAKIFQIIQSFGCSSIHIGGGEPMLRPDKLGEILLTAAEAGVSVEYVETNSSWFRDMASAVQILSNLREKGLNTLLVSVSPFHNAFIPFAKVKGVMTACMRTGINIFPWVDGFMKDLSEFDPEKNHSMEEFKERFGKDYLLKLLERYWIHMGGRALNTYRKLFPAKTHLQIIEENPGGCFSALSDTTHFHIDLYGNYIPGLCSGISVSMNDLGKPLSGLGHALISLLAHHGIRGLYEFAQKENKYEPRRTGYLNKCDLCTEIRGFLVKNNEGVSAELRPVEFYANLTLE